MEYNTHKFMILDKEGEALNDFLNGLSKALRGNVPESYVKSNLDYYRQYILDEISKGKKEEDVLSELGDPRLIAKNIISTSTMKKNYGYRSNTYEGDYDYVGKKTSKRKGVLGFMNLDEKKVKRAALWIGGFVIVAAIIWLMIKILWIFLTYVLPAIIVIAVIKMLVRYIRSK